MKAEKNEILYFAYGSNLSKKRVLKRKINFAACLPARLENYQLVFNKVPLASPNETERFANIAEKAGEIVEGAVYQIDMESLKKLDLAEGAPTHYQREEVEVTLTDNNEKVKAFVYIAHPDQISPGRPSRSYLNFLLDGKDILSPEYFHTLALTETID